MPRKKGRGPSKGDLQNTNPAKRPFIRIDDCGRWKPSRGRIVRTIGCICKRHLMGPYASWTMVPEKGKEKYWSVFKETYNWDPEQEDKIHNLFNKEIRVSMNRSFSVLHKELKAGEEKPEWLCEEHYKGLMEYWDTEAFKKRSDASVSNRSVGEKITHRFGSSDRYDNVNRAISTDIYIKIRKEMPLSLRDEKWVDEYLLNPSSELYDRLFMTHDSFLTLLQPGKWLHGDVLDCVAYDTWNERVSSIDSSHWNLPTHFSTFAQRDDLNILDLERKVFGRYGSYIGRPDECLSVSIPIYDLNHWLLCRIDFEKMEIAICDTLRDHSADARRKQLVLNAVKKLDQMSKEWDRGEFKVPGWIDTFEYCYSTTLPQQLNTYDCGIYVCLLMMFREGVNRALSEEELASTRKRIAYKLHVSYGFLLKDINGVSSASESSNGVLPQHNQSETHVQTDIPTRIHESEIDALDLGTQETVERDENVTINQTEETITPGSTREAAKLATEQPMVNSASTIHGGSTDIYINICKEMPLSPEEGKYVDECLLNPSMTFSNWSGIERNPFLTLRPGNWLHGDVLDNVAYVTWHERSSSIDSRHWNLPTHLCRFAQMNDLNILDLERKVFGRSGWYRGRPDECLSVSIPIYDRDSRHWLLCRIDFEKMEIAICDTLRNSSVDVRRKQLIRIAVEKLDQMSREWKLGREFKVPIVTLPYIYSTTLPQQPNTYDCGLYVCLLMMFREGVNRALSEVEAACIRRRMAHKLYYANLKVYEKHCNSGVLPQLYQSETHVQTDIPPPITEPETDAADWETQETVERDENVTINQTQKTTTPGSKRKPARLATEQPIMKCSDQYSDKVDKMSENGSGGTHQSPKSSIAKCMSILYTTEGVEVHGKVWLYATTTLFLNSDYRELFSALKPPDRKVWLESMLEIDMQKRGMSTPTSAAAASRGISGDNEFAFWK